MSLLNTPPRVISLGLDLFARELERLGVPVVHLAWTPPAGGDARLAALLERCRFAVGTDNGVMHLASARGVPQLRLFGPTDPGVWGPWPEQSPPGDPAAGSVTIASPRPCAPCHRLDLPPWSGGVYPCMAGIRADTVIAAVESLWAATAARFTRPA